MTTTTETQVEYLTEIKFRNAVKRTLKNFRVLNKNEYRGFAVRIEKVFGDETLFKIRYSGGDFTKNFEESLKRQLNVERQLTLAGFELVQFEERHYLTSEMQTEYGWRLRAN